MAETRRQRRLRRQAEEAEEVKRFLEEHEWVQRDPTRSRDWEHLSDFSRLEPESQSAPESPIEALLRAGIGEEPERATSEEDEGLQRAVEEALDELDPFERELIEAYILERVPIRKLGERFGIHFVTLWNMKNDILDTLERTLVHSSFVQHRLRSGT
jgi:DNA-directed RNA polymerase specialized sigma24 family protein